MPPAEGGDILEPSVGNGFNRPNVDMTPNPTPIDTFSTLNIVTPALISLMEGTTPDNDKLFAATMARLRQQIVWLTDISDPDIRFSLSMFLAFRNEPKGIAEDCYNGTRKALFRRYEDAYILSLHEVKNIAVEINKVISSADNTSGLRPNTPSSSTNVLPTDTTSKELTTVSNNVVSGPVKKESNTRSRKKRKAVD